MTINISSNETFGHDGVEQQMVDAQACVSAPCVPEIIPKGIDFLIGMEFPQRVGPTLRDQAMKGASDPGCVKSPFVL